MCPISLTKCCSNFALREIRPIEVFASPYNNAEFIVTDRSKEMEERKHEEGKNGRQEQGNAFNASFQTM
jgi:hypothetical protein